MKVHVWYVDINYYYNIRYTYYNYITHIIFAIIRSNIIILNLYIVNFFKHASTRAQSTNLSIFAQLNNVALNTYTQRTNRREITRCHGERTQDDNIIILLFRCKCARVPNIKIRVSDLIEWCIYLSYGEHHRVIYIIALMINNDASLVSDPDGLRGDFSDFREPHYGGI